ncbi:MAG: hypothetical protein H8E20_09680 [Verrucomicrobia bacterium]|nr:hypothetical protein [Verrucomicrobiota bacterium]
MKQKPTAPAPFLLAALLLLGSLAPTARSADDTPKGPPAAVRTSFEAVAARLDPNGHLYAYLSTEQALAQLSKSLEGLVNMARTGAGAGGGLLDNPFVTPIIEGVMGVVEPAYRQSGIGEISGVGMSSLAIEEDLWRSKLFVHHLSDKGTGLIWDAFGEQPHAMEVLSLAPDNTAALMHGDVNVTRIIDWADEVFGEMLGGESVMANAPPQVREIVDSFANEAGFLMTLDAENKMVLPGFMFDRQDDVELDGVAFALLLRVNDDTLKEMIGEALGGGFGPPPGTQVSGVTIHSIPLPIPLPIKMDLSPCYFQVGDYMVLSSAESLAKRMAKAHGGDGRLTDDATFKALANGLNLKANGIYYANPRAAQWGLEVNELSFGKLEGGLAKVYEIYKESMKDGLGMVSLFKVQEDGLLIEANSTVNPYGGNIVHSIAGVGVAVASSLNDLRDSGLFEDLGGFGGPPDFDDEPEFDPLNEPIEGMDLEAALEHHRKMSINGFYGQYDLDDADQLTADQIRQIAKGEDNRSNIPEAFGVFQISGTGFTANITFTQPDGGNPFEVPEHHGTQKFVDGKYFYFEGDIPKPDGGADHMRYVYHLSEDRTRFVSHGMFNNQLNSVGVGKVTGQNRIEWTGSAVMDDPVQGTSIMTFTGSDRYGQEKSEFSGTAYLNGEPWFKRKGVITKQ